jgi:hypothetical protein
MVEMLTQRSQCDGDIRLRCVQQQGRLICQGLQRCATRAALRARRQVFMLRAQRLRWKFAIQPGA